ncbi:hypothetical protein PUN28_013975 [Cardiocondyla obscurior]|uniref:Uncharacterized protein n=1 Tax=Cardiocondyla obscurior TaxID=286306 RepID=A0AAW2F7H2_9HYME
MGRKHSRKRKCFRERSTKSDYDSSKENRNGNRSCSHSRTHSRSHEQEIIEGSSRHSSRNSRKPPSSSRLEKKLNAILGLLMQEQQKTASNFNLSRPAALEGPATQSDNGEPSQINPDEQSEISVIGKPRHLYLVFYYILHLFSETVMPNDNTQEIAAFKMDLKGSNDDNTNFGPAVHDLITKTWSSIFTAGLSKENRDGLRKKYPAPQNLTLAKAPTLNAEVRHSLPQTSIKRDEYQVATQNIIEASIAAQAQLMTELLKPEDQWNFKYIFETASDVGRLTSHVQYHLSRARRALITLMLTISAKNALEASPIDKQLFGKQYLSKIKDASAADKLVRTFLTTYNSATKQKALNAGKSQQQTRNSQQGNAKSFAPKSASRRGAKAAPRLTRHRLSSRSRSSHYR